jgi:pimeloyl-ACP methyl ester carboxylesterase
MTAMRAADLLPDAVVSLIPGGGHAAHLQQPATTARVVQRFLEVD